MVNAVKERHGRIDAVVHAAGVLRDGGIAAKSLDDLRAVIAPKVLGAIHLDEVLAGEPLDAFVLFSSASGSLGNRGQCDYAFANAYLDAFADVREGLRVQGSASDGRVQSRGPYGKAAGCRFRPALREMRGAGLTPMPAAAALRLFEDVLASPLPRVLVLHGHRQRLRERFTTHPAGVTTVEDSVTSVPDLVRSILAEELHLRPEQIDDDENLEAYGVDSISLRQLEARLSEIAGPLPKTMLFECRNVRAVADYLSRNHAAALQGSIGARPAPPPAGPTKPVANAKAWRASDTADGDIAIIGIAGRYPGAANVHQLWRNLAAGNESIVEVPPDRWDWRQYFDPDPERTRDGRMYTRWGGFLEDVAAFDPRFFGLSQRTAELADPQERLFLQIAWATLEDAGYTRASARAATAERSVRTSASSSGP